MGRANPASDPASWTKAIERAHTLAINRVSHCWTLDDPDGHVDTLWFVLSATEEGREYAVRTLTQRGVTTVTCNCPAGDVGRRCWHAAAVLLRMGLLVEPEAAEARLAA